MSEEQYTIQCPECGHEWQTEVRDLAEADRDPDVREQILANRFNFAECPSCSYGFRIDRPVLYLDRPRAIVVHWIPLHGQDLNELERQYEQSLEKSDQAAQPHERPPRPQLVLSRNELIERVFLLEEGYDERVVEYLKYLIYTKNISRMPPDRKELLFDVHDSTEEELLFVVRDLESSQFEELVRYSRSAYDEERERFEQDDTELRRLFPGAYKKARFAVLQETGRGDEPVDGE
ncbi:CpXC domain-containing protein [Kiritimatiella glycovorans]|uniref:CpXC domain-containing protein n=1 Tax=Kiritimatiella glycovorans TaxID=1307763 RepID=A0A0G3EC12_9BACT|nr:CpXC domain-containing protein [Kiritimatiella glycovorans]AKJ63813.1 hypothetical protein L21SP4_00541 [Kiritimatiella glycovorans]